MTDGTAKNYPYCSEMLMIRDRLWCRAACEALGTVHIERLMRKFNELREEKSDSGRIADPEKTDV